MDKHLVEQILEIAHKYLGPEARRFLERQAKHIDQELTLEKIEPKHLEKFAWWVNVSAKLIMEESKAKQLASEIEGIGGNGAIDGN